mmetsp:Transcript_29097/g.78768  ORF Transcript_29097/g.78768 Transcript_29097/m.78768 type:complete len:516 (+) Transcript_29097:221-1768(+)
MRTNGIIISVLLAEVCVLVETTYALSSSVVTSAKEPSAATTASNDSSRRTKIETTMRKFHAREVEGGKEAFSATTTTTGGPGSDGDSSDGDSGDANRPSPFSWSDDDFVYRDIGERNAGVDATYLPNNGNAIFESRSPVVTAEECSFIIDEARETIARGLIEEEQSQPNESSPSPSSNTQRAYAISNSQLGEARLSNMPKTRAWLRETLQTRFYPLLENRFGLENIVLYDGLVLGNQAPTRSQPIHRDASLVTLNVALSSPDDYDGGGTYIQALDEILTIDRGHLLCHAGSAMHAGNAITRGERWVFVLFLLGTDQPQLARRCHAEAIELIRQQRFDEAEIVIETGLESIAPFEDHLLQNTMGRLHLTKGEPRKALRSFRTATEACPTCHNAAVSMARILIDKRRPRAALRRFDAVLEAIRDRDLDPNGPSQLSLKSMAYGARRDAARCALVCADHLYRAQSSSSSSSSFVPWTRRHLPTAIDRLNTCLTAAPNEPSLLGMLNHAEYLLGEAEKE